MATCIVCGSDSIIELGSIDNEIINKCNNCTLVFVDNSNLNLDKVGGEYEEERNLASVNKERVARLKNPKTILDFGCGHGRFVDFCTAKGIQADGIDLHTRLQLNNLSETYDAITMVEVIEHLSNPVEVLTILSNHLNPNGVLYIEGSFTDTEYLYGNLNFDILKWWYLRPSIGHITLFNQKSMEVFLSKCGLKLIEPRFSANVFRATKES